MKLTCQETEHIPAGQGLNKKKEELEALKPRIGNFDLH